VPGGGVAPDGKSWVACTPGFFLPIRALTRLFRRRFLAGLEAAFQRGELRFFGDLEPLAEPRAFAERVRSLRQSEWVGYVKPPVWRGPPTCLPISPANPSRGDRQFEARRRDRRRGRLLL